VSEPKPFAISKQAVWEAYLRVKANAGAAGVDGESIAEFEGDLKGNLYKLWNRLSSGSYMAPPVRGVQIPKRTGSGVRMLGVPTVADRIAQTVVRLYLEPGWNRCFTRTPTATDRGGPRLTRWVLAGSAAGGAIG
jgi:retron-type reverse transcriptase